MISTQGLRSRCPLPGGVTQADGAAGARFTMTSEKNQTATHAEATELFVDPIKVLKLGSTSVLSLLCRLQSHDHPQQGNRGAELSLLLPSRTEVCRCPFDSDI